MARAANDGQAGLEVACSRRPDRVVTDIDTRLLSGVDALLEMRLLMAKHPPNISAVTDAAAWRWDAMTLAVFDRIAGGLLTPDTFPSTLQCTTCLDDWMSIQWFP